MLVAALAVACGDDGGSTPAGTAPPAGRDAGVATSVAPVAVDAAPRIADARGAELYAKYCALCHGPEARGYAADNAPSLVSETFLASASDAFLARSIAEGRPPSSMAPYARSRGGPLADEDIAAIVRFLRGLGPRQRPLPATRLAGDAAKGKAIYEATCTACHGNAEARGPSIHLANPVFLSHASDAFLRHAIVHGRPGVTQPMVMQAYGSVLSEQQIADVVAYIRSWAPATVARTTSDPHAGHAHHGHDHHGHDHGPPIPPGKEPPKDGPVVINPKGKQAKLTARDGRFVSVDDAKKAMIDQKRRIVMIDARPPSAWIGGHIPGAISMPHYDMHRIDDLPKDGTWILAYCACPHHQSGEVVDELKRRGFENVAILDEGINVWQQRGYPIAKP